MHIKSNENRSSFRLFQKILTPSMYRFGFHETIANPNDKMNENNTNANDLKIQQIKTEKQNYSI